MASHSTCSATTQASSITPTESAPPVTHETHSKSRKCGTSVADLTAQPPTKKQAKVNKPITDNEETENVQKKQGKKIVKAKKAKKTRKTSEMKRAEDAAADEEGVPDLTAYESSLPVAPPKQGPSSDVPQPAAPVFTVTHKRHSDMEKVMVGDISITSSKPNKKHTEDQISKGKGSDKSNDNHTEDSTSKNKEGDIIMTSPPVSPPCVTSKPGTVDTVDIANISPKGSSRSEGGILRGNALGNHPNATDFHSAVGPIKGWIWLYVSNADPSTVMVPGVASFTLKHNLTVTIRPVLKKLKDKAEHFFTADHCLYVYESRMACKWSLVGIMPSPGPVYQLIHIYQYWPKHEYSNAQKRLYDNDKVSTSYIVWIQTKIRLTKILSQTLRHKQDSKREESMGEGERKKEQTVSEYPNGQEFMQKWGTDPLGRKHSNECTLQNGSTLGYAHNWLTAAWALTTCYLTNELGKYQRTNKILLLCNFSAKGKEYGRNCQAFIPPTDRVCKDEIQT
ncbi:hypothetical protein BDQ17DRAFT_1328554 [Cyathus striatus]|nr:hypothetical protein BDQ17DRAFT_1328554 [Cyathus striatus]